jgi:hypothetical protein
MRVSHSFEYARRAEGQRRMGLAPFNRNENAARSP